MVSEQSNELATDNWELATLQPLQQVPGDDQPHDFVGAFVNLARLGVPEVALQGVIREVAVAPQDLHPFGGRGHGRVGGESLGHGGGQAVGPLLVFEPGGLQGQEAGGFQIRGHVRQFPLDGLKIRHGLAELPPLFGIGQGLGQGGPAQPHGDGRGAHPGCVQGGQHHLEPLVRIAQEAGLRQPGLVKKEGDRGRAPQPQFLFPAPPGDLRGGGDFHHKGADPLGALPRVGERRHQGEAGLAPRGDEVFAPGEHPAVLLPAGHGLHPRRVGARLRFGQGEAGEDLSPGHRRQPGLFLGRGAELGHGPPEQGVVHVEDQGRSRTGLGQLHLGQDVGHIIQALAAVFPGESQAEHACFGPELQDFPGKLGLPVQPG